MRVRKKLLYQQQGHLPRNYCRWRESGPAWMDAIWLEKLLVKNYITGRMMQGASGSKDMSIRNSILEDRIANIELSHLTSASKKTFFVIFQAMVPMSRL